MPEPFQQQITFCYVDDLPAQARFYERVLGLRLALDQGACRIYHTVGRAYVGFCTRDSAPRPEGIILTLVSDDVDGWYEHLKAAGASLEGPPAVNERFRIYHVFFRDPAGYRLEIQRFESPDWREEA